MMMFSEQFSEQDSDVIDYKGKKIHRFFSFEKKGSFLFRFSFVKTNSPYEQAIDCHLITFKGKIIINGKEQKWKGRFPQVLFTQSDTPSEFEIEVILDDGNIVVSNASAAYDNSKVFSSLVGGCAMIIEEKGEDYYRFYCNDHENDDDFDDLIFDLRIVQTKTQGDGSPV